ncbi:MULTISPECIES: hypothetical protein [unclassified Pseudomonas]|uniref:hypothetical protein n=1 Tax=unclassified Pseudomonas TaxID=196821 RepID=UPI0015A277F7|nr:MULTISPECIES: hypothetical protein [unclassified Pseudomonas]NWC90870.1 hypothetical protein [Pseudomonas sp. IPO3779]NWD17000.1 hypothetical protein [Pseudomonas sp. IPO3778]
MNTANTGKISVLTEFFSNTSDETRRDVLKGVISKASASQRDVVQKAEAIKAARFDTPTI